MATNTVVGTAASAPATTPRNSAGAPTIEEAHQTCPTSPPSKLLAGAEACRAMLLKIEEIEAMGAGIEPASDAPADLHAAYAGQYKALDEAVAVALDEYATNKGFRLALGHHLFSIAQGSFLDVELTTAAAMVTDGEWRPMPEEPADALELAKTLAEPGKYSRRAELVDRLPVLLQCVISALKEDEGDNPATYVLASVALEDACELQEQEGGHA